MQPRIYAGSGAIGGGIMAKGRKANGEGMKGEWQRDERRMAKDETKTARGSELFFDV